MREPALLEATASFLADAAHGGAAVEFGIGTGRGALRLSKAYPTTGSLWATAQGSSNRRIATFGLPKWTSWPNSLDSLCENGGRTGIALHSRTRAPTPFQSGNA